jgi:hypothetical protein
MEKLVFICQDTPSEIKESINTAELNKKTWLYDSELDAGILRMRIFRSENNIGDQERFLLIYKGHRIEFDAYTESKHSDDVDVSVTVHDISYEVSSVLVPRSLSEKLAEVHSIIEKAIEGYGFLGASDLTGVVSIKNPPINEYHLV